MHESLLAQDLARKTTMLALIVVLWLAAALHAGLNMGRRGRRWWVWFLISTFLTVIPAAVISYMDYFRDLRRYRNARSAGRVHTQCPHCRAVLTRQELIYEGGQAVCPRCKLPMGDDARYA